MLDAGAFDLLEKPYRAQDLCWVITSALKRPTGRNTLAA
jgi:FixJ family two-component response regulator